MYSNVAVIAFNTAIFKQAGLTRGPASLDEQLAFARQIAQSTGKAGIAPALSKIDGLFMQQGLAVIDRSTAPSSTRRSTWRWCRNWPTPTKSAAC